jgi:electron transfer flavoprotein beta subunit
METILVPIAEAKTLQDNFEVEGIKISERFCSYELNEWDEYALEEAVQFREQSDIEVEVVIVSIGPERTEETIRTALAKGADRAVRIWDNALSERELFPTTKTIILKSVVQRIDPRFVLTGVQSSDNGFGATGVMLADSIGYQWVSVVRALDVDIEDDSARVRRELEGGVESVVSVNLPAVFTIQTGINTPRYASLRSIREAQQKELAVRDLNDISVDVADLTSTADVTSMRKPETESDATILEGEPNETAGQLAEILSEKGVGKV